MPFWALNEVDVDINTEYSNSNSRSNETVQNVLPLIEIEFFDTGPIEDENL